MHKIDLGNSSSLMMLVLGLQKTQLVPIVSLYGINYRSSTDACGCDSVQGLICVAHSVVGVERSALG